MSISFLNHHKEKQILVLGDTMLDQYIIGSTSRISPEAPVPIVKINKKYSVLGGAGNCAANLTVAGMQCTLLSSIGNDNKGKKIIQLCKKLKINFIPFYQDTPTISKTRIISNKQQLLRLDEEDETSSNKAVSNELLKTLKKIIAPFDVVIISDYGKNFIDPSYLTKVIEVTNKHNIPAIIDPKPHHKKYYSNCSFISPNWKEALELVGEQSSLESNSKNQLSIAKKISKQLNCNVILTLSKKGILFFNKNTKKPLHLPTEAKEVYDVSGAGDTVISWFAIGLAHKLDFKEVIYWANKAAGIVVSKIGTSTVSIEDFLPSKKKLSLDELKQLRKKVEKEKKTIVSINGCFDVLHAGHLKILQEAKKQGGILVVGLNTDEYISKNKGKNRPIFQENDRVDMLLSLSIVDYVYVFPEKTPIQFLKHLKPNVHTNGSDYGSSPIELSTLKALKCRLHMVNLKSNFSSTSTIKKINNQ